MRSENPWLKMSILAAVLLPGLMVACVDLDGLDSDGDETVFNGSEDEPNGGSEDGIVSSPGGGGVSNKVYYVSNDGDDDADGLAADSSFKTLSRAGALALAGDTIAILPGVYTQRLMMENVGNAQAPLTIRGEGPGVILDGQNGMTVGIWCEACLNVVIEQLEIRNYTDSGIVVDRSSNITLRQLTVHDNGHQATLEWMEGYGIHVGDSQGITIEDNEVYANGPSPQRPGRLMGTGIDTFGNTDVVIRNNFSHDNTGGGMLVEDSVNVLVEDNVITGNDLDASAEEWWDGGLWVDGGHNVTVRNNVFTDNLGPGIVISNEDNQEVFGYLFENNIITGNYYGLYIWNFGTSGFPPDHIVRLTGNDISGNSRLDVWIEALPCPPEDPCI